MLYTQWKECLDGCHQATQHLIRLIVGSRVPDWVMASDFMNRDYGERVARPGKEHPSPLPSWLPECCK